MTAKIGTTGAISTVSAALLLVAAAAAQSAAEGEAPSIAIVAPAAKSEVALGSDAGKTVDVRVAVRNFVIKPIGQCGGLANCGHVHLAIDYPDKGCNAPGSGGNSTNSDTGGSVVQAHFGYCPTPTGAHVVAVALAHDDHSPVLIDGKPVAAFVPVTAK